MNMKLRNIPFSPPDMSDAEIEMVAEALRSGWITTGPKTKEFEQLIAMCCGTEKAVCLNSATACMESILRALGVGPGDEVITSAYTYTATASITCHVGAKVVMVDTKPGSFEMDYDKMADAITERTKWLFPLIWPVSCVTMIRYLRWWRVRNISLSQLMIFRMHMAE